MYSFTENFLLEQLLNYPDCETVKCADSEFWVELLWNPPLADLKQL